MDISSRNRKAQLRRQYHRFGPTQQKILLLLLGGMALSCTRSPGQQWKIIKGLHAGWQDIKRQAAERALSALYESQLIEAKENSDGTLTLVLSENGRKKALTYRVSRIRIAHSGAWNKKWWIVLYDIPEDEREARDAFRDHLTRLGFRKLQNSAGIYPFPCKNELDFVMELLDVRKYVRVIEAEHIDNEAHWKRLFRLEP
ncbi:MAG: CRISPR-associated endonuclease Cas2 [bacterium]|nr:CRISPR-associated endonuclease Cas2 [bacterium]